MTEKVAFWALWISGGSLFVSIASFVLAWKAKQQAKQAATLTPRTEAIDHLRNALHDVNTHGSVRRETVASVQMAMHRSVTVFSPQVTNALNQAYANACRLNVPLEHRTPQVSQDTGALREDLQALIERMNEEAKLVG